MQLIIYLFLTLFGTRFIYADEDENEKRNNNKRILLEDNYYALVSKLDKLTADVASLKAQQEPSRKRVAFKAHLGKSITPGTGQLIEFDDVIFNQGHAYHHGTFVAPYNGTYLFSVHMCCANNHYIYVNLMRNGVMIGQVLAGDTAYHACSSETTVTELVAGDDVTVQHNHNYGDNIFGDANIRSSFTGVLLY